MKKTILTVGLVLFALFPLLAQNFGFEEKSESLWTEIKGAAKYILATVFLISVIANSGKLMGENRDYMAFFRGVLIWAVVIGVIAGVVSLILGLTF
ncbi:MAG: hypothetical protein V3U92_02060 [Cellulophaga sp.]